MSSFQPSELTKIGLIVFYATYLTKHKNDLGKLGKGFIIPFLILLPVILVLLVIQSHFSAAVVIGLIVSVMMIIAGTKFLYFISVGAIGLSGRSWTYVYTCKVL